MASVRPKGDLSRRPPRRPPGCARSRSAACSSRAALAPARRHPFGVVRAARLASLLAFGASALAPHPPTPMQRRARTRGGGLEERAVAPAPGARWSLLGDPGGSLAGVLAVARVHSRGRSPRSPRGQPAARDRVLLAQQQAHVRARRRCRACRGRSWHERELLACTPPASAESRGDPERDRDREQNARGEEQWPLRLHEVGILESASTRRLWPFAKPRCAARAASTARVWRLDSTGQRE